MHSESTPTASRASLPPAAPLWPAPTRARPAAPSPSIVGMLHINKAALAAARTSTPRSTALAAASRATSTCLPSGLRQAGGWRVYQLLSGGLFCMPIVQLGKRPRLLSHGPLLGWCMSSACLWAPTGTHMPCCMPSCLHSMQRFELRCQPCKTRQGRACLLEAPC